jgi:pantetheine-phosphate adenylyltransferase
VVDRLVVAILPNATKETLLTLSEREALLRSVIAAELGADVARVEILAASNLAVRIAEEAKASVIIRGLRAGSDFEAELRMAHANRLLAPSIETLFLMTAPEHASTSSRLVREIARYGGPLDRLVPEGVIPVLTVAARRHADANG